MRERDGGRERDRNEMGAGGEGKKRGMDRIGVGEGRRSEERSRDGRMNNFGLNVQFSILRVLSRPVRTLSVESCLSLPHFISPSASFFKDF